jgi:hypothetical protein
MWHPGYSIRGQPALPCLDPLRIVADMEQRRGVVGKRFRNRVRTSGEFAYSIRWSTLLIFVPRRVLLSLVASV